MTLPQLTALRSLVEQTTSVPGMGPGSYSRSALIKRINVAIRNFPDVPDAAGILPPTVQGGIDNGRQINSESTQAGTTAEQLGSLNPTERKRARLDDSYGRNFSESALGQLGDGTGDPGRVSGSRLGLSSSRRSVENGSDISPYSLPMQTVTAAAGSEPDNVNPLLGSLILTELVQSASRHVASLASNTGGGDENIARLPDARYGTKGTHAQGQLSRRWYKGYLRQAMLGKVHGQVSLQRILQGETLERAKRAFEEYPEVLQSLVVLGEHFSNGLLGTIEENSSSQSGWIVVINSRILFDPEDLLFLLAEEAMHIWQKLGKQPFDYSLPYNERPHEIAAKAEALKIAGRPERQYKHSIICQYGEAPSAEMRKLAEGLLPKL